jgi:hypothetical protein
LISVQTARPIRRQWPASSQDTNGTKAAQTANKPTAIPVAVKYVRIVSSPPRLGSRNHDAVTRQQFADFVAKCARGGVLPDEWGWEADRSRGTAPVLDFTAA